MSHRKQGLRVLGVSLLAMLGLMAFLAGGAQATNGAKWLILGSTFAGEKWAPAELHSKTVLLLVGGTFNIVIHCEITEGEGIFIFGEGSATGKIAFKGCTTSQGGKTLPGCEPTGQPIVVPFKALLILHNSETYILFSPPTGEAKFATVKFSELCSLAPSKNLTGTLVAECGYLSSGAFVHLSCSREEATHLLRQAPEALFFFDGLLFGAKPASLDGIGKVFLFAELTEPWGGIG